MEHSHDVLTVLKSRLVELKSAGRPGEVDRLVDEVDEVVEICRDVAAAMQQTESLGRELCDQEEAAPNRVAFVNVLAGAQAKVSGLARQRG
ncbi:MAG: hypothetical protein AAFO75_11885, partial [Pseudomonadota bacterium]